MKRVFFIGMLLTLFSGCFFCPDNTEPPYPQNITGWKYRKENGTGIIGEFVLKKGESTNNGEVEITLVDLIPAKCFVDQGNVDAIRRAKIRVTRMSDGKVICEGISPNIDCGKELSELWISGIGVLEINIKEQWTHIILTGSKKE